MYFDKYFCKDNCGLAPVVGTILMVGIVIVLATVIWSNVLSYDTPDDHYERFKEITSQNINGDDLPPGLVAHWTFDGTLEDASGNGNNGNAVGSVSFVDGVSGQAIRVDDSSYVEVPSSESLNITDEITLVAYIKWDVEPSSADPYANIICKGNTDDNSISYRMQHAGWPSSNSNFEFSIYPGGHNKYIQSEGPEIDTWYQVVGTYDGSKMILYVNGDKKVDKDVSGDMLMYNTPLCIGSADGSRNFIGRIDEVQIYNRALSEAEVKSIGE